MSAAQKKPPAVLDVKDMPEVQIECRTFGHAWTPARTVSDRSGITIELDCSRCGTTRTDRVNRQDGSIEGRSYGYVPGYRGHGKVTRSNFRFEFVARNINPVGKR